MQESFNIIWPNYSYPKYTPSVDMAETLWLQFMHSNLKGLVPILTWVFYTLNWLTLIPAYYAQTARMLLLRDRRIDRSIFYWVKLLI